MNINATYDAVYYDDTHADTHIACEVHIDGDNITVCYVDDDELITYKGKDEGGGHFLLECPMVKGKATLHRTSLYSKILEGYWVEDGEHGFWRVYQK